MPVRVFLVCAFLVITLCLHLPYSPHPLPVSQYSRWLNAHSHMCVIMRCDVSTSQLTFHSSARAYTHVLHTYTYMSHAHEHLYVLVVWVFSFYQSGMNSGTRRQHSAISLAARYGMHCGTLLKYVLVQCKHASSGRVCVCVCVYVFLYVYIYTHIHMYIRV